MPIKFQCEQCQASYAVPEKLAGKRAKCKKCGDLMTIPQQAPTPALQVVADLVESESTAPPDSTQSTRAISAVDDGFPCSLTGARGFVPAAQVSNRPQAAKRIAAVEVVDVADVDDCIESAQSTELGDQLKVTKSAQASVAYTQPTIDTASLLAAIQGSIQPVPTTGSYRLAALVVAGLMILLPLIYIGIIGATIYGVVYYAFNATELFQSTSTRGARSGVALFLLYIGPLFIGVLTVLFMIKPLFARSARNEGKRTLERKHEPTLFAFVDRLCESVHAPKPKRIDVDCDVNASASFRRGILSMLSSGDLVLTIGMPLAAGLTSRQLAGVLAHEFGHFSQGFGMRVSYIVRTISHWFSRVVYERDRWDQWLANTANSIDIRIGIILHLARILIWLTRRILWGLMMVGHAFSCYLLRQMEYDADLHEIRFAGSDTFRETSMQLRRLGVAYQQGIVDQQTFFMDGKLGNNLPRLTRLNRDGQDEELVRKISAGVMEEKTEWLTTHPVDRDRVARAKQENEAGVFQLEAPASVLFDHFEAICEAVTADMFHEVFGDELKPTMLVPVEQLVMHKAASEESNRAMRRMFGNYFRIPRHMSFAGIHDRPMEPLFAVQSLRKARQEMIDLLPAYDGLSKQFDEVDSLWMLCFQVEALIDLGAKLDQKDFNVPVQSKGAVNAAADGYRGQLAALHTELTPLESAFERRVAAAGSLLQTPEQVEGLSGEAVALAYELGNVCQTLAPLQSAYREVAELRNQFASLGLVLRAIGDKQVVSEVAQKINARVTNVAQLVSSIAQRFQTIAFPFQHADGSLSMTKYMLPKPADPEDLGAVFGATQKLLENYFYVYFRSIGTLSTICQRVEDSLGLSPQPDPRPLPESETDKADAPNG